MCLDVLLLAFYYILNTLLLINNILLPHLIVTYYLMKGYHHFISLQWIQCFWVRVSSLIWFFVFFYRIWYHSVTFCFCIWYYLWFSSMVRLFNLCPNIVTSFGHSNEYLLNLIKEAQLIFNEINIFLVYSLSGLLSFPYYLFHLWRV